MRLITILISIFVSFASQAAGDMTQSDHLKEHESEIKQQQNRYLNNKSLEIHNTETIPPHVYGHDRLTKLPEQLIKGIKSYPLGMLRHNIPGKVKLGLIINESGEVVSITTLFATNRMFEKAALHTINSSTFSPGQVNGKNVPSYLQVIFNFRERGAENNH